MVCPNFKGYTVGMEASASGRASRAPYGKNEAGAQGEVEQKLVARVTTGRELSAADRETVEGLIRLDVPELDRVEFSVQCHGANSRGYRLARLSIASRTSSHRFRI